MVSAELSVMIPESGTPDDFKEAAISNLAIYGIWDTQDKCWMGDEKGPFKYTNELHCRAAMTIMGWRFRQAYRFRKRLFWEDQVKLKDVVTPPLSAEQAIIENKA